MATVYSSSLTQCKNPATELAISLVQSRQCFQQRHDLFSGCARSGLVFFALVLLNATSANAAEFVWARQDLVRQLFIMGGDVEVLLYAVRSNKRNELWPDGPDKLSHKLPSMNPTVPGAFVVPSICISRYLEKGNVSCKSINSKLHTHFLHPTRGPFTSPSIFSCSSLRS